MKVLYASCRRNFDDPFIVGGKNLFRAANGKDLDEEEFLAGCKGKRVLVLVHGYRSETSGPYYTRVLDGINKYGIADHYDVVIGYLWAGGYFRSDYAVSSWRADRCAKHLLNLSTILWPCATSIDVQTHSLGAHVALEALRREGLLDWQNLFLLAPAVADESIEKQERFGSVGIETGNTFVFYSKRDKVLEFMFPVGEALTGHPDFALGYHGAEDASKLHQNVKQFDCTPFIDEHSAYRTSPEFHKLWLECLAK
jgi:hypothetical protein